MKEIIKFAGIVMACFLCSATAWAQNDTQAPNVPPADGTGQSASSGAHPGAVTYSDGYQLRARIHKIASYATIPLFATEYTLGQSLYKNPSTADARKGLHVAAGSGIIGLFGVNAVTGIWNMLEDRRNPEKHTLRLVHGLLMLSANAGFVATAATGPHSDHGRRAVSLSSSSNRALHRDLAYGSIGIGTIGYTLMLFGKR